MKKLLPWIIIGAILFLWFTDRSSLKNDLGKIEKNYLEEKTISETTIAIKNKDLEKKDNKITELNGALDSSATVVADLENKIAGKDKDLDKIRKSWASFSIECQMKLEEIDSAWAGKFSLAQVEIEELKKQVRLADDRDLLRQGQILDLKSIINEKDKIVAGCEAAQSDIVKACLKDKQRISLKGSLRASLGFVAGFVLGKV